LVIHHASLSSPEVEVAVTLEDAILMARTGRENQSPVVLVLSISEKRGRLASPIYYSHRSQRERKI
jgi:hypothetical protein